MNLKQLRTKLKMTLEELAFVTGLSVKQLSLYESQPTKITFTAITMLCEALSLSAIVNANGVTFHLCVTPCNETEKS